MGSGLSMSFNNTQSVLADAVIESCKCCFWKPKGGLILFPQVSPDRIIYEAGAFPNCIYHPSSHLRTEHLNWLTMRFCWIEESTMKLNLSELKLYKLNDFQFKMRFLNYHLLEEKDNAKILGINNSQRLAPKTAVQLHCVIPCIHHRESWIG